MRSRLVATTVSAVVFLAAVLSLASTDAQALETFILPGSTFETWTSASSDDTIVCTWQASGDVRLTIRAPSGDVVVDSLARNGFKMYDVDEGGTYHFEWENLEATVVSLDYNIDVLPFSGVEDMWDAAVLVFWLVIIGAIVMVVLLVVIILVLVRSDKPRVQQGYVPASYPQYRGAQTYAYAPPSPSIQCSGCGASISAYSQSCPKCGKRLG